MALKLGLEKVVRDFATGIVAADALRPCAKSHDGKKSYRPGLGPHSESTTVTLVLEQMAIADPQTYSALAREIPYPTDPLKKCDLSISVEASAWYVELKMLRLMGDNGKPNDNMLMHILSPYPQHNSALTDCLRLSESAFPGGRAVMIFGYEYPRWPLEPVIQAFESLASQRVQLGERFKATFDGLVHPVHEKGAVFGWSVQKLEQKARLEIG